MSKLSEYLDGLRAQLPPPGTRYRDPTYSYSALERLTSGKPLAPGVKLSAAPTVKQAPSEPVVESVPPPEPEKLPLIPMRLGPRQPLSSDLVWEAVQADPSTCPGMGNLEFYDTPEMLARYLAQEFHRYERLRDCMPQRVMDCYADGAEPPLEQGKFWCEVCHPNFVPWEMPDEIMPDLELVFQRAGFGLLDEYRARCLNGCTSEAIAAAVASRVTAYEHKLRVTARAELVETMAAESSFASFMADPTGTEQEWVIPQFVAADGLTLLSGTAGDGKTWLAMYTALCAAAGAQWFERDTRPTRTLLLLLEGGKTDHRRRISLITSGMGLTETMVSNLSIYPLKGFRADDPQGMLDLIKYIETLDFKFVVIDNLTNARANVDENSAARMGEALRPLAELANERKIGVLLIHHANAQGEVRGSSAIKQHPDMIFQLDRKNPGNGSSVYIRRTKDRYGASFDKLRYRFVDHFADKKIIAVCPTVYDPEKDDKVDVVKIDASIVLDGKVQFLDTPWGPLHTDIMGMMPCSTEHIYKTSTAGRNKTLRIRKHLEALGKVFYKDGVWERTDYKDDPKT